MNKALNILEENMGKNTHDFSFLYVILNIARKQCD